MFLEGCTCGERGGATARRKSGLRGLSSGRFGSGDPKTACFLVVLRDMSINTAYRVLMYQCTGFLGISFE